MTDKLIPLKDIAARVGSECLCLPIQRASRTVGRHYDEALRPLGLNNWQFTLLMSLNKSKAPTVIELANWLGMDRTTVTANLKPLERRGYIEIRRDETDGRAKRIGLTPAGEAVLREAFQYWEAANAVVTKTLTPESQTALRTALKTLADG
jgi:DNA-binding MarR family transcriptional regulator